jgi:hypothetical protein
MVTAASRIMATAASTRATSSCGAGVIPAVTAGNTSRGIVAGVFGRKCHDRHKTDVGIRAIAAVAAAAVVNHNCTAKRGVPVNVQRSEHGLGPGVRRCQNKCRSGDVSRRFQALQKDNGRELSLDNFDRHTSHGSPLGLE